MHDILETPMPVAGFERDYEIGGAREPELPTPVGREQGWCNQRTVRSFLNTVNLDPGFQGQLLHAGAV